MSKRTTGTLAVLLTLLFAAIILMTSLAGVFLAQPGPLKAATSVTVPPGSSVARIADILHSNHIISHPRAFALAARATGLATTLKAGEYTFHPAISMRAVLNKLALGETALRSITIPEGWTVRDAMALMAQDETGLTGNAPIPEEGTLFPDTYAYNLGTKRADILKTMQNRAARELATVWETRAEGLPLNTPQDLLILASIVEKEAANEAEMPMIAAVFINRLKQGMKLQADPTVLYGAEQDDPSRPNIRRRDLTEPHPFNTYVFTGLPPTPISNPGRAALLATANPAGSDALFFVADPSRTHHVFSKTYAEHRKNVENYWRNQ